MELKREFTNAAQLLILLHLLYWCLTWNLPTNFDDRDRKHSEFGTLERSGGGLPRNKQRILSESIGRVKRARKRAKSSPTAGSSIIRSFDEWREEELNKQGRPPPGLPGPRRRPPSRVLNYASSGCGAKLLASNPEAKHGLSVLNERKDEYMLNPCRARQWFVIELCDAVEVMQLDLANYELYSSSPRDLSVYWSEVYPAHSWHILGTFEAEDRRTLQSFPVEARNLGKFVKVVISSHHGREHFCALSTIRLLGYSMVYEFEEIEKTREERRLGKDAFPGDGMRSHLTSFPSTPSVLGTKRRPGPSSTRRRPNSTRGPRGVSSSLGRCILPPDTCPARHRRSIRSSPPVDPSRGTPSQGANQREHPLLRGGSRNSQKAAPRVVPSKSQWESGDCWVNLTEGSSDGIGALIRAQRESEKRRKNLEFEKTYAKEEATHSVGFESRQDQSSAEDSAALIQKESVLMKLTARIKTAEVDLDMVNKYLQELSQSYRRQMEDMHALFNATVRAIHNASREAQNIDDRQEEEITKLESRMSVLKNKVEYWVAGQKDILKRVAELHAFFLVLQFIVISTLSTVFLNNFRWNCRPAQTTSSPATRNRIPPVPRIHDALLSQPFVSQKYGEATR